MRMSFEAHTRGVPLLPLYGQGLLSAGGMPGLWLDPDPVNSSSQVVSASLPASELGRGAVADGGEVDVLLCVSDAFPGGTSRPSAAYDGPRCKQQDCLGDQP